MIMIRPAGGVNADGAEGAAPVKSPAPAGTRAKSGVKDHECMIRSLTESHSLLAMGAVILLRRGNGIGWRPVAAGDVR
jgi:hypothetical protein